MVFSSPPGKVLVSLITIPTSRHCDRRYEFQASLCDLGRVSTLAANVMFPRPILPPAIGEPVLINQKKRTIPPEDVEKPRNDKITQPPKKKRKTKLAQLIAEREQLNLENEELKRKLSLFQQLFRNRQRLASVTKIIHGNK